jgi:DNA-binding IclR family transcriptional regulator
MFTVSRPWWTLSELASASQMPVSTTSRLLGALERVGAVRRDPASHRYSVGAGVLPWARVAQLALAVHVEARRMLEHLAATTTETAALYLRQGHERVCIDVVPSPQQVHRALALGEVAPLKAGAAGRAIAAYLPDDQQLAMGVQPAEMNAMHRIRDLALTCSYRDRLKDAWAIASPIKDQHGDVASALVVTGPLSRYHTDLFFEVGPQVRAAALICSRQAGAPPEALGEFGVALTDLAVFGEVPPATHASG